MFIVYSIVSIVYCLLFTFTLTITVSNLLGKMSWSVGLVFLPSNPATGFTLLEHGLPCEACVLFTDNQCYFTTVWNSSC